MPSHVQENIASKNQLVLRAPGRQDAPALYELIRNSKPLDLNSRYLYMLLSTHFHDTCVVGTSQGKMVCAVTGYLKPGSSDTLFIWQIAVRPEFRSQGIAGKLLDHIVQREICRNVRYLEATVTPSNTASWKLFEGFAKKFKTEIAETSFFHKELFEADAHEEEKLLKIGPFKISNGGKA